MIRFWTLEAQLRWWLFLIHDTAQHVAIGRIGTLGRRLLYLAAWLSYNCNWNHSKTVQKEVRNELVISGSLTGSNWFLSPALSINSVQS
jgi:hypothetical protein